MLPLLLALVFSTACEKSRGSGGAQASLTEAEDADGGTHERFPDGLHPDASGRATIAKVFAGLLSGDAGSTVVCLGDSITAGGYPSDLASRTGMNVVNAGVGGELSSGGLARVNSVLDQHNPSYLCILYGANDVIHNGPPSDIVANLRGIASAASARGCTPIVGTLTPMSGDKYGANADDARAVSSAIRGMGVTIADLERAF